MPDITHPYDKKNDTHLVGEVDTDHWGPVFLVPHGMIMGGRPEGGEPWQNFETTAHDCGERYWSTVYDQQFGLPIGRRLDVAVYGGPIGNAYEGHISGSVRIWFKPLGEFSESQLRQMQAKLPTHRGEPGP